MQRKKSDSPTGRTLTLWSNCETAWELGQTRFVTNVLYTVKIEPLLWVRELNNNPLLLLITFNNNVVRGLVYTFIHGSGSWVWNLWDNFHKWQFRITKEIEICSTDTMPIGKQIKRETLPVIADYHLCSQGQHFVCLTSHCDITVHCLSQWLNVNVDVIFKNEIDLRNLSAMC